MKKQVILSLFLLITLMGMAVAEELQPVDPLLVRWDALLCFLGLKDCSYYEKYLEALNESKQDLLVSFVKVTSDNNNTFTMYEINLKALKYITISEAKSKFLQVLTNTGDKSKSEEEALKVVTDTYKNFLNSVYAFQNNTVEYLNATLPDYIQQCRDLSTPTHVYAYVYWENIKYPQHRGYKWVDISSASKISISNTSAGFKKLNIAFPMENGIIKRTFKDIIKYDDGDHTFLIYNLDKINNIISKAKSDERWVVANLQEYFSNIAMSGYDLQTLASKMIDPYMLIHTLAGNESVDYLALAHYMLALEGFHIQDPINISKIEYNGTIYEGYIYANEPLTLEANKTITAPTTVYLLTLDGRVITIPKGENFTVVKLVDQRTGQELSNVTLVKYTYDLSQTNKFLEEMTKLIELQNKLLERATTVGGGSSDSSWADSINNFWNSLDWQVKAIIIGGGILTGIVLIGRSFGRGGVSVIRLGK